MINVLFGNFLSLSLSLHTHTYRHRHTRPEKKLALTNRKNFPLSFLFVLTPKKWPSSPRSSPRQMLRRDCQCLSSFSSLSRHSKAAMRQIFKLKMRGERSGLFNAPLARKDGTRSQFFPRVGLHLQTRRNLKWVTRSCFTRVDIKKLKNPFMEFELKEKSRYSVLLLAI